jgi:hypothetical protein
MGQTINDGGKKPYFSKSLVSLFSCIFIFALTFAIYLKTLLPTVGTGDVAKYQFISTVMGIPHNPGYPLYLLISKLFSFLPVGSIAFRINLMSAFFASLTGCIIFLLIKKISENNFAGLSAALVFCFSNMLWSQAVIAEVHTLNIFFITLILFFLINYHQNKNEKYLYFAVLAFAFGIGHHFLIFTVFPSIIITILFTNPAFFKKIKKVLMLLLPFLIPAGLYIFLYIRAGGHPIYNEGEVDSLSSFVWYITGGVFKGKFFSFTFYQLFDRLLMYVNILLNQFAIPVVFLSIAGAILMLIEKTRIFLMLLPVLLLNMFIIINYGIYDIDIYIIPSVLIISIFWGYLLYFFLEKTSSLTFLKKNSSKAPVYSAAATILIIFTALSFYNINRVYSSNDNSREYDHYLRSKNILEKVEDNAVVIPEDYFVAMTLNYYIWVESDKKDVLVPFSYVPNIYFVDSRHLKDKLGLEIPPLRMNIEDIAQYKKENNLLIKDIEKIIKIRPVYILNTDADIENTFILEKVGSNEEEPFSYINPELFKIIAVK